MSCSGVWKAGLLRCCAVWLDNLFPSSEKTNRLRRQGYESIPGLRTLTMKAARYFRTSGGNCPNIGRNNAEDLLHPYENKHARGLCSGNTAATQAIIFTRAVHLSSHSIDKNASCSYRRFTYVNGKLWSTLHLEFSVSPSHTHTQSVRFKRQG
jgi:hypothetical protein